ncbi:MAG: BatD family protein [Bdellovibrionales bacterium]|nr:BatD family protein [Bdellovibrionales bacterium]
MSTLFEYRQFLFFFLCVFSSYALARGSEVRVSSTVHPNPISLQGVLTLTVEIEYSSEKNIGTPRLPGLDAFDVIGQHQSHEFQMINGVTSRKKKYHYQLQPQKEGKFNIGGVEVIVDGKAYETAPVTVEVSSKIKPRSVPSSPFRGFRGLKRFFPPFFEEEEDGTGPNPFFNKQRLNPENIFMKLEIKKSEIYVGEMLLAEWFLYLPDNQAMNISSEMVKSPNLDGFWVESVVPMGEVVPTPSQREEIQGKKYRKQLLTSSALFPVRSGDLHIGSFEIKNYITFPFTPSQVFSRKSDPKKIKVVPLPKEGKGLFFTEAVGDFHVSASVNKKVVSIGEPVVYKVHFKGTGQTRVIRLPPLEFGKAWEVYDTTESQQFSISESVKNFKIILIPKSSGELTIPPFEVSTFDPYLGIYKTHILPSFTIKVVGVPLSGVDKNKSQLYFQTEEKKPSSEEKPSARLEEKKQTLIPWVKDKKSEFIIKYRKVFWLAVYSVLFIFLVLILVKNFSFRKEKNRLKIILETGLKRANKAIKKEDWKQAGIELNQMMYSFFSELSGQDKVVKNWDILLRDIHPSIRIKYESKILALVSYLERLSFASVESAGKLRNQKNVEHLKMDLVNLLKTISTEYSLPERETS